MEAAIAAAGGVHMLLIMLDSLDRSLRDLCTRILTDLAADDRVRWVRVHGAAAPPALPALACPGPGGVASGRGSLAPPLSSRALGGPARANSPVTQPAYLRARLAEGTSARPPCSTEILSAPGGTAKVIQLMYRGILDGQASAGRFLELLAGSKDEAVQVPAAGRRGVAGASGRAARGCLDTHCGRRSQRNRQTASPE